MILAISAGNTQITFGCVDDKNIVQQNLSITTDLNAGSLDYAIRFSQAFSIVGILPHQLEGVVLASVVPSLRSVLKDAIFRLVGKNPLVVEAGVKTGLKLKVDDPGTVGSDLVCAAVTAKEEYPLPCVIVDMGAATTLTCVDGEGNYIGGAILPGMELSLDALIERTSLLPRIDRIPPKKAISTSTVECMRSGILYGSVGAIDGILNRFEKEEGFIPASLVCTGKIAPELLPFFQHEFIYDETLILKGLGLIWRKNQKNQD